ncbi:hypothetical protein [Pelotomaculum propionicicum]|uniref:Glycosyltransferase family 1 protein n=1 Tax=Pelotomaculum propionicicum TaxID=258475 RepID=A0A4Y7RWD6_9FIRM|nr:hypothetical protein [Pelotomaculum propionicicum]NLI14044.1 hypothetical protein [Peptococcaceae bacterium]TEB12587.1 hypothetical protein Pmgp_00918 [Pelotomaculum propionicicum]
MKFCLLSAEPYHPDHGKIYTIQQNNTNIWAAIMGGTVYNGPLFDRGDYGLDYDYFDEFDLVMLALRQETIEVGIKVKQRSKTKVIVFLDAEVDYFTTYTPLSLKAKMVELLNMADAVAVLHDESVPFFKALTTRPVGLVGLPFPLKRVRQMCPPVQKQEEIELGSSISSFLIHNRNALINLAALSEIGMPGVVNIWEPIEMEYVRSIREYLPIQQIKFRYNNLGWDHYITQANYSLLGLHLDNRYSWGRFPIDCAAVRMPCVAPPSLYTQKILFPRLCVPHRDIEGAVALVKKLVSDADFYEEVISYAESQIELFSYEQCKMRLFNLIS